jgi:hypothetical protein
MEHEKNTLTLDKVKPSYDSADSADMKLEKLTTCYNLLAESYIESLSDYQNLQNFLRRVVRTVLYVAAGAGFGGGSLADILTNLKEVAEILTP